MAQDEVAKAESGAQEVVNTESGNQEKGAEEDSGAKEVTEVNIVDQKEVAEDSSEHKEEAEGSTAALVDQGPIQEESASKGEVEEQVSNTEREGSEGSSNPEVETSRDGSKTQEGDSTLEDGKTQQVIQDENVTQSEETAAAKGDSNEQEVVAVMESVDTSGDKKVEEVQTDSDAVNVEEKAKDVSDDPSGEGKGETTLQGGGEAPSEEGGDGTKPEAS